MLFLGPLAILFLPVLVIPLRHVTIRAAKPALVPPIGYDSKPRAIGSKRGSTSTTPILLRLLSRRGLHEGRLGLGYTAFIGTKNHRGYITIDAYTINNHVEEARQTNFNLQETENFSNRIRGQFGDNYTGDFGPN